MLIKLYQKDLRQKMKTVEVIDRNVAGRFMQNI